MNQTEFYKRISGLLDTVELQKKRVAVIGLGSGGCRVAAELGRMGVQLLLVERPGELLQEHNIVRHLLGYSALGKSKLAEMARYITSLNAAVSVRCCALDVAARPERLATRLASWRADLIAVCTDNEPSKHALNEVALRLGIPQTGGAVYDDGIGGEVYRVRPGQACYGCIAAQLQLDRNLPSQSHPQNYSSSERTEPATSALSLDIQQIALLQCRLTLDLLLDGETGLTGLPPEVNVCVFANRVVPGTFARPMHAEFFRVIKRADCLSCGTAQRDFEDEAANILSGLGHSGADPS